MTIKKRYVGLDAIRGLSALFVMLYHYTTRFFEYNNDYLSSLDWSILCPWGCCAVTTFFILSGFLSYHHLCFNGCGVKSSVTFLKKRFVRLYPAFLVCLPVSAIFASYGFLHRTLSVKGYLANLTMMPGLLQTIPVDGAYWTLQVEWLFYVGLAIIMLAIPKYRISCLNACLIASTVFYPLYQHYSVLIPLKVLSIICIPSLLHTFTAGMAIYMIFNNEQRSQGVLMLLMSIANQILWQDFSHTVFFVVTICAIMLVLIFEDIDYKKSMICRFLIWFSSISYSFYLLHQVIGHTIIDYIIRKGITAEYIIVIPFVFVTILAWFVTRYIEPHMGNLFKKILKI